MARFALGVAPSNKAWAAAARLPGTIVVQKVLAALRNNTDKEASLAATSDSKAAAQATLRNCGEPEEEAEFGANRQAKREGHTRKEAGRVTKRKSHHPGGPTPQVLTADKDANVAANWQAKEGGPEWRGRLGHQEEGQPRVPPGRWNMQPPRVDGVVRPYHR